MVRFHRRTETTLWAILRTMRGSALFMGVFVVPILLWLSQPTGAQTQNSGLDVVVQSGIVRDASGATPKGLHNFGMVDPLDAASVEQVFLLQNTGKAPLVIDRLQPTCGCSSAIISDANKGDRPFLAAGEQIAVRVSLDVSRLKPGPFVKYVQVYIQGHVTPVFVLEMAGSVKDILSFTPDRLDFGACPAGKPDTLDLKARLDPRLIDKTEPLRLVSSNPDVRIEPLEPSSVAPATDPKGPVVRSFRLTLSAQARLGEIQGFVCFIKGDGALPKTEEYDRLALVGRMAPLAGLVAGDITALPHSVVFGSVLQGNGALQRVTLVANAPGALDGLTISSSSPYLTARLQATASASADKPGGKDAPETRILEVSLSPKIPPGASQPEITITTKSGQRLVLIVYLSVLAVKT